MTSHFLFSNPRKSHVFIYANIIVLSSQLCVLQCFAPSLPGARPSHRQRCRQNQNRRLSPFYSLTMPCLPVPHAHNPQHLIAYSTSIAAWPSQGSVPNSGATSEIHFVTEISNSGHRLPNFQLGIVNPRRFDSAHQTFVREVVPVELWGSLKPDNHAVVMINIRVVIKRYR